MSALKWEQPPKDGRGSKRGKWADIAAGLRSRPGEWAKVVTSGANVASRIRSGTLASAMPRGEFDATCRKVSDNPRRFDVWARYIGDES